MIAYLTPILNGRFPGKTAAMERMRNPNSVRRMETFTMEIAADLQTAKKQGWINREQEMATEIEWRSLRRRLQKKIYWRESK